MNEIKDTGEIVKALRWFAKVTTHCEHNIVSCPECEFHGFCTDPYSDDGICKMHECLTAAASLIESLQAQLAAEQITSQSLRNAANGYKLELDVERKKANDARNELCLKCGRYHEAHNGACAGCRWGDVQDD